MKKLARRNKASSKKVWSWWFLEGFLWNVGHHLEVKKKIIRYFLNFKPWQFSNPWKLQADPSPARHHVHYHSVIVKLQGHGAAESDVRIHRWGLLEYPDMFCELKSWTTMRSQDCYSVVRGIFSCVFLSVTLRASLSPDAQEDGAGEWTSWGIRATILIWHQLSKSWYCMS